MDNGLAGCGGILRIWAGLRVRNWRRKRLFGFLSPRADFGVSFSGAFCRSLDAPPRGRIGFAASVSTTEQLAYVGFSNRPFRVKRFQTIHHYSVDVAHELSSNFGDGRGQAAAA